MKAFWKGFCSVFDIFGTLHETSELSYIKDDAEALRNDWEVIGQDMYDVFGQVRQNDEI